MNYRLLFRVFGILLILLSLGMALCMGFAHLEALAGAANHGREALGISAGITVAAGIVLFFAGLRSGRELLRKEAIVVVGLGWFISASFGMLPYILGEPALRPMAAFFESVSGFTTTGSTVITDLDPYPRAILLWRSLTQWLGGVGILVLFVALLSYLGAGGKSLFRVESSANTSEGTHARIRQTALLLWGIYLGLSAVTLLGLRALGMSWFDAACHTMTTVATGGFGNYNESIAHFDNVPIEIFLMVMMIASSISFFFYAALVRRQWNRARIEEEGRFFVIVVLVASVLVVINLTLESHTYESFGVALRDGAFQVASVISTTGFATADFDTWPGFSQAVLLFLMMMGGCSGSTAGGIKVGRVLLFLKATRQEVISAFRPRRVIRIELNRRPAEATARSAIFVIAIFASCLLLGTLVLAFLEPKQDFDTCFSAATATLFNIGPGLSGVGPSQNFAFFHQPALVVMSILMVAGRLELFAVLALFVPSLWRKY